jgi:histidinol dehydrogenase
MLQTYTYKEWSKKQTSSNDFNPEQVRVVQKILSDVKELKDKALLKYTKKFDQVELDQLRVSPDEIEEGYSQCSNELIDALKQANINITRFHKEQLRSSFTLPVSSTSYVGQIIHPLDSVGLYVPGGTAAYPSTVLMNALPAIIAGVKRIVMITPPSQDGTVNPAILAAAKICGITEIYKIGGAQGIGALAYGTETIRPVRKIVGPGNIYVALAKREVFGTVGIDMIAGPSEILVYADETSTPEFVAADLLSQAEHDVLARSILVTTSKELLKKVNDELAKQIQTLSRERIARDALANYGAGILVSNEAEAIEIMNEIAPEHLELLNKNPEEVLPLIRNAGAVFVGEYSPEPLGDYMAGPNHTLPTSGTATFSSALSVDDFITKTSVINYSKADLARRKDAIITIATEEGLTAHANAVQMRYNDESK